MRRRELIAALGALPAVLAAPGRAQQAPPERVRRIGFLTPASGSPEDEPGVLQIRALVDGLRQFGWVDGRNITIDHHSSGAGRERIAITAKELVEARPDVILAVGGQTTAAVLAATRTIPVVFTTVGDPVANGLVASVARPGGNATGVAVSQAPIAGSWLQLLKEVAPTVSRVIAPAEIESPTQHMLTDALSAAAPAHGVSVVVAPVREITDYEPQIAAFAAAPGGGMPDARMPNAGMVVVSNPIAATNQARIHALALRHRLPTVYTYPVYARTGGLLSYGADNIAMLREAAGYIDRILRGEPPGDLPVQQASRFVLAVNLRTARELGLTVPPALLARADEVIE